MNVAIFEKLVEVLGVCAKLSRDCEDCDHKTECVRLRDSFVVNQVEKGAKKEDEGGG